jgi:hypothetical protein
MGPAKITPTDLRQFKRWLVEQHRLKPNTVNRKLATAYRRAVKILHDSPDVASP